MNIDWDSSDPYLLLNPTYSPSEQDRFNRILTAAVDFPAHVWLSTSGSSSRKWVGLSKHALLASAEGVNRHLKSNQEDRWVNALPSFHVGGLGIWARAHVSGAQVSDFKMDFPGKWDVDEFYHYLQEVNGTLSALVPAQLHDLVEKKLKAPSSLRALVIGGGLLLPALYEKAVALGWAVLPSYGLTECASQVATAPLESIGKEEFPFLQLLPHLKACEKEGRLAFSGPSLLSVYASIENENVRFFDPKIEGWFLGQDRGVIHEGRLKILGRTDDLIKIGGESVDLARLDRLVQTLCLQLEINAEAALVAVPDSRLGYTIVLAAKINRNISEDLDLLIKRFQNQVLPFERIRKVHFLEQLPRSALGKILKAELVALLEEKEKNL